MNPDPATNPTPEAPTPSTTFYKLWKHLFDEHGLVVTESEMNEIARLCPKVIREPREGDFKYLITYGGGLGPDVWDREVEVSAVNIQDAINQVIGDVEDAGGWIYAIDQNDYPPISRQKLESSIADLERALAEAKRENRKLTLELGAERMGAASRAGTLDLEVELKETKRHRDSLSSENERLKADKERLDWLENRKATFHCTSDAVDLVAIVPAVRNAEQHPAGPFHFVDFRRAIDHARTTQEGQG